MPRTKFTEEQLKESKKLRNKKYYQETKIVKSPVIYIISGLPNGMYYVGSSFSFEQRQKAHLAKFGDVQIKPIIMFKKTVDFCEIYKLNCFESLVINAIGKENCLNKNNTYSVPNFSIEFIKNNLQYVASECLDYVNECLEKIERTQNVT
jgi:hypothetical protein